MLYWFQHRPPQVEIQNRLTQEHEDMKAKELIQNLINLQNAYAHTFRMISTSERLGHALARERTGSIDVRAESVREPLLEHVGHLPVIASFLYTRIAHSKKIDLGRVLIMLSIHDIGETITGDVLTYKKTAAQDKEECEAARTLLSAELRPYFDEFEKRETLDAKYAKSVDALAPFLHELNTANLTRKRLAVFEFDSEQIEAKKRILFDWDPVLRDMFEVFIEAFRKIERGEPVGFTGTTDLTSDEN